MFLVFVGTPRKVATAATRVQELDSSVEFAANLESLVERELGATDVAAVVGAPPNVAECPRARFVTARAPVQVLLRAQRDVIRQQVVESQHVVRTRGQRIEREHEARLK